MVKTLPFHCRGHRFSGSLVGELRFPQKTSLTYGHGGRGGRRGGDVLSNKETYITICKIDNQWEFAVGLRKLNGAL